MAAGSLLCGSNRTVKFVPPSTKLTARRVLLPSFWFPAARNPLLASSALSNSVGEARSSSRGDADARHRFAGALVVDHVTERGGHHVGIFDLFNRWIFHVAIPLGARHAVGEVPGDRERRIAQHARLAIGGFGLAGLPVHGFGLDRKRL